MATRDCFLRFHDDLCQVILSFLSLTDCFSYQCVSKQWKYIIITHSFKLHRKLVLSTNTDEYVIKNMIIGHGNKHYNPLEAPATHLNYQMFEKLLSNLPYIDFISFKLCLTDKTLDIISKLCLQLKHLFIWPNFYSVSDNGWRKLSELSFQNLETIYFHTCFADDKIINKLMPFTPNLKTLAFTCTTDFDYERVFWPKLENLYIEMGTNENVNHFSKHFSEQLKSVKVSILDDMTHETVITLTRFINVEQLSVWFMSKSKPCFKKSLNLIDNSCKKIKVLELKGLKTPLKEISSCVFKSLVSITVNYSSGEDNENCESMENLKNCSNLKYIRLFYAYVDKQCFKDVYIYLPKVNYIDVRFCDFIDKANIQDILIHLSKLENLSILKIGTSSRENNYLSSIDLAFFISRCSAIRRITTNDSMDVEFLKGVKNKKKRKVQVVRSPNRFNKSFIPDLSNNVPRTQWILLP